MLNPKKLEEIAKQISASVPPGVKNIADEIESKAKQVMQRKLTELDFVTREEFDVQTQVLARTRQKLEALELRVLELEKLQGVAAETTEELVDATSEDTNDGVEQKSTDV